MLEREREGRERPFDVLFIAVFSQQCAFVLHPESSNTATKTPMALEPYPNCNKKQLT